MKKMLLVLAILMFVEIAAASAPPPISSTLKFTPMDLPNRVSHKVKSITCIHYKTDFKLIGTKNVWYSKKNAMQCTGTYRYYCKHDMRYHTATHIVYKKLPGWEDIK